MYGINKLGKYFSIEGHQVLVTNPVTNSITVNLYAKGFLYGYLLGDFNSWEKREDYRLDWDKKDNLSMFKYFHLDNLSNGRYFYSFILINVKGEDVFISSHLDKEVSYYFDWQSPYEILEIITSSDVIIPGHDFEFVSLFYSSQNRYEPIKGEWTIAAPFDKTAIYHNHIYLANNIDLPSAYLTLHFQASEHNIRNQRKIPVLNEFKEQYWIHFFKHDKDYTGHSHIWEIWSFDEDGQGVILEFKYRNKFMVSALAQNPYFIIKKREWNNMGENLWAEQTIPFKSRGNGINHYVVYGQFQVFYALEHIISFLNPCMNYVYLENSQIIAHYTQNSLPNTQYSLYINHVLIPEAQINDIQSEHKVIISQFPLNLKSNDLVYVTSSNTFLPAKVLLGDYLDQFYYGGDDLGLSFDKECLYSKIWAPTAKQCEILFYDNYHIPQEEAQYSFFMYFDERTGIYYIKLPKEFFLNKYYLFRLSIENFDTNGVYEIQHKYVIDPYAKLVGINGNKSYVFDLLHSDIYPSDWYTDTLPSIRSFSDIILYEVHVRDFSISLDSGIHPDYRGKYLGLAQEGTYTDKKNKRTVKTGLAHLRELGITHVHLLPIYDFSTTNEIYEHSENRNWGYDPKNYFVPDGSYATDPYDPINRIRELCSMIRTLHKNDIRVVLDVVYNHVFDTSNFNDIVDKYFFRLNHQGQLSNGSGCGNEIKTERPMMRKFIIDSLMYWIKYYHIDGIRFDLWELMDFDTTQQLIHIIHKYDPNILIYGEPWSGGDSPLFNKTSRGKQKNQSFSIFNDVFRDGIRGKNIGEKGFVNGDAFNDGILWSVIEGLKGSINTLTAHASESINYVDCHDNYTLWDQIEKSLNPSLVKGEFRQNLSQDLFDNHLIRRYLLAMGIVLTSQGIPFLAGGIEFLRSKQGDHNSYKSNDEINAFHWEDKAKFIEVFEYIRGLIQFRKEHSCFRMFEAHAIQNNINILPAFNSSQSGCITAHFRNFSSQDNWREIFILYNATEYDNIDCNQYLPGKDDIQWHMVINHKKAGIKTLGKYVKGKIPLVKSYSMLVLHT